MPTKKLVAFYDDPTYDYKKYWQERQYECKAEEIALKALFTLVSNRNKLVDIGAGFGRLVPLYAPLFQECLLIDPSQRQLEEAKKLTEKYTNLTFKKAFAEKLPLEDKSFDVVLFIRTFHHLEKPELAVKEVARVLKPGGFLVLEFANKIHLKSCLRAIFQLNPDCFSLKPEDISREEGDVPFLNYHPRFVEKLLLANKLKPIKTLSVSNFRHPLVKKIFPLKILLFLEAKVQELASKVHLGPSIFLLAQKA